MKNKNKEGIKVLSTRSQAGPENLTADDSIGQYKTDAMNIFNPDR
jgi:hypothetical protein